MNKDFELKKDPRYNQAQLRGRINHAIKRLRDETEELQTPHSKSVPVIPVTGSSKPHKYLDNKSKDDLK